MKKLVASAFVTLILAAPAFAEVVNFTPMQAGDPEYNLVRSFLPDAAVETAMIHLDPDNNHEVLVRLNDDCIEDMCRVQVYRMMASDWGAIFDRYVTDIEIVTQRVGLLRNIYADGLTYSWNLSSGLYEVDAAQSGQIVEFSPVPAEYVTPLLSQFGEGALALFEANTAMRVHYAAIDTAGTGANEILVRLDGGGACGLVYGCPMRLLRVVDGAYDILLEGFTASGVSISRVDRGGRRDIISTMPFGGHAIYAWTGDGYGQAEFARGR